MRLFSDGSRLKTSESVTLRVMNSKVGAVSILVPVLEVIGSCFGVPGIGTVAGAIVGVLAPKGDNSLERRQNGFE